MLEKKKMYPTHVFKNNSSHEKQVILSFFPNGER